MTQRNSTLVVLSLAFYLVSPLCAISQTLLNPNQPEQDACHALTLCGGKFFTPYSYQGTGRKVDLPNTPCQSGEDNSMWLKVKIASPGLLVFRIIPKDTLDDYDFAVVNASGVNCESLSAGDVVRCNFNNNFAGSNPLGIVGMSDTGTQAYIPGGYFGNPFIQAITANAGDTYLVMVNNFGHDDAPGPSNGFTIDFGGSTATFAGDDPPAFQDIVHQCSDSSVIVQLSKPILCSSITPDGSEFYTTPAIPIARAAGVNCVGSGGYTSQVVIYPAGVFPPGNYVLYSQPGTGGSTVTDLCGTPISTPGSPPSSIPFSIPAQIQGKFLPPDTTKCNYSTISVIPTRQFASYAWSNGDNTPSITVTDPGIYTLHVTDSNTCRGVDSIVIRDSTCPQYVYIPSAFTPNGDGRNDKFRAVFAGPTNDFKLAVYDRWGRMVFETGDPFMAWDGTTGGNPQPSGTYAYICIYRLYQQPQKIQRGTVLLIR